MSNDQDNKPAGPASKRLAGKAPPRLPLSVFQNASSPSPLSADPSTVFPGTIIDANVAMSVDEWKKTAGAMLKIPCGGLVIASNALDGEKTVEAAGATHIPLTAIISPTHLADRGVSKLPAHVTSANLPMSLSISFSRENPTLAQDISMALSAGHCVDLDIPWVAAQAEEDSEWDALEETLGKAVEALPKDGHTKAKPIVIGNLLPPPHSLTVPIVKLLRHPTYQAYQAHISTLSFIPNTYLKFLPPSWKEPTPPSPGPGATFMSTSAVQAEQNNLNKEEWKRRVKMYLGPALDAFGFSRIMFGSSPSPSSTAPSTPHDWYMLVREVVAELAVDQQGMDLIFGGTAKSVYGA